MQLKEVRETQEIIPNSTDEVQYDELVMVTDQHVEPQPRRSIQTQCPTVKYTLLTTGQCDDLLLDNKETITYMEIVIGSESKRWLDAMRSEIEAMR